MGFTMRSEVLVGRFSTFHALNLYAKLSVLPAPTIASSISSTRNKNYNWIAVSDICETVFLLKNKTNVFEV